MKNDLVDQEYCVSQPPKRFRKKKRLELDSDEEEYSNFQHRKKKLHKDKRRNQKEQLWD